MSVRIKKKAELEKELSNLKIELEGLRKKGVIPDEAVQAMFKRIQAIENGMTSHRDEIIKAISDQLEQKYFKKSEAKKPAAKPEEKKEEEGFLI